MGGRAPRHHWGAEIDHGPAPTARFTFALNRTRRRADRRAPSVFGRWIRYYRLRTRSLRLWRAIDTRRTSAAARQGRDAARSRPRSAKDRLAGR